MISCVFNQENFEEAVDFAVNKEFGTLALATPSYVDFFDLTYNYISRISIDGTIEKVVFCELIIIVQVNTGESVCLVAF